MTRLSRNLSGAKSLHSSSKTHHTTSCSNRGLGEHTHYRMRNGDSVDTAYGEGIVDLYRETDKIYVIDLPFGILYATKDAFGGAHAERKLKALAQEAMRINAAYESLETMRKLNLEVACEEGGIYPVDFEKCSICLLSTPPAAVQQQQEAKSSSVLSQFPRLNKIVEEGKKESLSTLSHFPRLNKIIVEDRKKVLTTCSPCLICASPSCRAHSSAEFRREGLTICVECEEVFKMDYVVGLLMEENARVRTAKIDRMVDSYDRALLLLKYSTQFMEAVAVQLDESKVTENKVGLGSSSAGLVSGALGIAAAATILTPAGPPLLIASLILGGSASAAQTGNEAINYFSEPNKIAGRIIALHGVALAILRVAGTLRDAMLRDHIRTDEYEKDGSQTIVTGTTPENMAKGSMLGAMTVGRYSVAGAEVGRLASAAETGAVAGRNARFFSRTGSNLMRGVRFARFAGGALSAAILVFEAKNMSSTIQSIQAGNPCEKADKIREIQQGLEEMPGTAKLDAECETYRKAMNERRRAMTEEEAKTAILEQQQEDDDAAASTGKDAAFTLQLEEDDDTIVSKASSTMTDTTKEKPSLRQRIEQFKERAIAPAEVARPTFAEQAKPSFLSRLTSKKTTPPSFHESSTFLTGPGIDDAAVDYLS